MTTLSQYLEAEDPDWSEPETFNLPHATKANAPASVRAMAPGSLTPYQIRMAAARRKHNDRRKAAAVARARAREQAEWDSLLASDGLGPV